MRAVAIDGYGGSDRLQVREVPEPVEPGPGQVRLRVRAAGINPVDWKLRRGSLRLVMPAKFPLILGHDVAGEVEAIGPEVTRFQPGDAVYGGLDLRPLGGGYAELALARESSLAAMPRTLSFEEAAALPVAGLTALQALRDKAELAAGETALINGAAGGVGHLAVQIAFAMGARVTGVASRRNLDFVRSLKAREAIDYEEEDFAGRDGAWDVIFDAVGNRSYQDCEPALARDGGIYVTTSVGPRPFLNGVLTSLGGLLGQKKRARFIIAKHNAPDLEILAHLVDQGRLRPEVQEVFPLERVAAAHDLSEAGHVRGKLVLRVSSGGFEGIPRE
ncbi:MAG TPA: NAD(P)-dependent alcohol dehydrogenase [Thermoanaerobaculia bacterium]|jgi:NADPH:quinone reductase-like Zn-dependent oxidoreductase